MGISEQVHLLMAYWIGFIRFATEQAKAEVNMCARSTSSVR